MKLKTITPKPPMRTVRSKPNTHNENISSLVALVHVYIRRQGEPNIPSYAIPHIQQIRTILLYLCKNYNSCSTITIKNDLRI